MKGIAVVIGNVFHAIFYAPLELVGYAHPIHPIFVHFTIGSVIAAFVIDYVGWIFRKPVLLTTARHNLVFAFPAFVLTGCVGLADWSAQYQVASLNPSSNPVMFAFGIKFVLSLTLLVIFVATYFLFRKTKETHPARHAAYLLLAANVIALGFYGGNIVYG